MRGKTDEVQGRREEMRVETGWYVPNLTVPGIPTKLRVGPAGFHSKRCPVTLLLLGHRPHFLRQGTREKRGRNTRGNQRKSKDGAGRKRERIQSP